MILSVRLVADRGTYMSVVMFTLPAGVRSAGLDIQCQNAFDSSDDSHICDQQVIDQQVRAELYVHIVCDARWNGLRVMMRNLHMLEHLFSCTCAA